MITIILALFYELERNIIQIIIEDEELIPTTYLKLGI